MSDIVLYGSIHSRTYTARWILEELGLPYRVEDVDIRPGRPKAPDFLAINPMGKAPALTDDSLGWADYDTALNALETGLAEDPWLLGEMFSAADAAVGSVLTVAVFNKRVTGRPVLQAYNDRLMARPACVRAVEANWPPGANP